MQVPYFSLLVFQHIFNNLRVIKKITSKSSKSSEAQRKSLQSMKIFHYCKFELMVVLLSETCDIRVFEGIQGKY